MFRKSARGLFDLVMAGLAVATLVTTTPAGELIRRGVGWALGMERRRTDLLGYFGSPGQPSSLRLPAAPLRPPQALLAGRETTAATIARAHGVAPSLLEGFVRAGASSPGRPPLESLTDEGRALLRARGASEEELGDAAGRLRAVSRAIAELSGELGSPDAALAALVVGVGPARYAAGRVRAERREPTIEALSEHLPPGPRERARQTVGLALALALAYDLAWPVAPAARITSRFGVRAHPVTGARAMHTGVDLSVPSGTPIWAAGGGRVHRAGEDGVNGRFLVVDHGRGITTAYCHASELRAARGSPVTRGETIALSGNTGRSTGPHLHYQVALGGVPIDPLALLAGGERALVASGK